MAVDVPPPPPAELAATTRSWFGSAVAIVGIVGGFLCLIVPGIFALRSWRRWERRQIANPTFAWVMAGVFVFLILLSVGGYWFTYGRPLLEDDFATPSDEWGTTDEPYVLRYVDGAYEIDITPSPEAGSVGVGASVWNESTLPNVAVEASLLALGGDAASAAGVGCANSAEGDAYMFMVAIDGSYLVLGSPDLEDWETLTTGSLPAGVDADGARIRGECRAGVGDHELSMFVDGTQVVVIPLEPGVEDFDAILLAAGNPRDERTVARFDDAYAIAIQP